MLSTPHAFSGSTEPDGFTIRAKGCSGLAHLKRGILSPYALCVSCCNIRSSINERIKRAHDKASEPPSIYEPHVSIAEDPHRVRWRLEKLSLENRQLRERQHRECAQTYIKGGGDDILPGPGLDIINRALVGVKHQASELLEKEGVREDTFERQLFLACVDNAEKVMAHGSKHACRYPPFVVRFAISLLSKVGKNTYDVLKDAFSLPSARHLQSLRGTSAQDPDGIMHAALSDLDEIAESKGLKGAQRNVFLSFDGCTLKDGVYWNVHSKQVVGFATDVYTNIDLANATRNFLKNASAVSAASAKALPLAKTYLVFYISFVDPNVKLNMPIARFLITKSTAALLADIIPAVISAASLYNFIVLGVVADGAPENRAALQALATIPASHFLHSMDGGRLRVRDALQRWGGYRPGVVHHVAGYNTVVVRYDATCDDFGVVVKVDEEELNLSQTDFEWEDPTINYHKAPLPSFVDLDQKIALQHPIDSTLNVFVWPDMPHVMKRLVNLLERSGSSTSRCSLTRFNVDIPEPLSLKMIFNVWTKFGGGGISQLRFNKLTLEHFYKDAFNRMRVPLALQIISHSVAEMLREAIATWPEFTCFGSLMEMCLKFDRLVDIMNGAGQGKRAPVVNDSQHVMLYEALEILRWCADWRQDLVQRGLPLEINFLNQELWEDLSGMVLSFVCTSRHYLTLFPGTEICQRRAQQDGVEHHFAHVRDAAGSGRNVTAWGARCGFANALGRRIAKNGANCSAQDEVDNEQIPGASRRKKKRSRLARSTEKAEAGKVPARSDGPGHLGHCDGGFGGGGGGGDSDSDVGEDGEDGRMGVSGDERGWTGLDTDFRADLDGEEGGTEELLAPRKALAPVLVSFDSLLGPSVPTSDEARAGGDNDGEEMTGHAAAYEAAKRPLTADEADEVRAAWAVPEHSLVVAVSLPAGAGGHSVEILDKHLYRHRRGWLFDESVNAYMWLLQKRDDRLCAADHQRKPAHFFSSYFFKKVNPSGARRGQFIGAPLALLPCEIQPLELRLPWTRACSAGPRHFSDVRGR
jgi:hypothetical protein